MPSDCNKQQVHQLVHRNTPAAMRPDNLKYNIRVRAMVRLQWSMRPDHVNDERGVNRSSPEGVRDLHHELARRHLDVDICYAIEH